MSTKVKQGDYLSTTKYLKVINVVSDSIIDVVDNLGIEFQIKGSAIIDTINSASNFEKTIEVNRTELATILENIGDSVFTVSFNKQLEADDFLAISRGVDGKILSHDELTKRFKKLKGKERILIGYLSKSEPKFGRSQVIDLEIPQKEHNIRQVDHRSLNWLINKNVKYIVK